MTQTDLTAADWLLPMDLVQPIPVPETRELVDVTRPGDTHRRYFDPATGDIVAGEQVRPAAVRRSRRAASRAAELLP